MDGGERSPSGPATNWTGGWVGLSRYRHTGGEEKTSLPCSYQKSNLGRPASCLVTILTELSRLSHTYVKGIKRCEDNFMAQE
jgi:hypothetical protein